MKTFKLWDTKENAYLINQSTGNDLEFASREDADDYRHQYLQLGNYPDYPYTVIEIHEA